jgi:hypothetical protein
MGEWNRLIKLKDDCGIGDLRHESLKHLKRYTHIKPEYLVARLG